MTDTRAFQAVQRRSIIDLGFLHVTQRTISSPDGEAFERVVIEHPGAVAVVPFIGDEVVLLRQYRAAVGGYLLEIPAGRLDQPGEDVLDAARRELAEETGYIAAELTHLTDLWTAPGFCDERISIFVASGIELGERLPIGPEETHAEVVRMPVVKAFSLMRTGEIVDAKTVTGLFLAVGSHAPT